MLLRLLFVVLGFSFVFWGAGSMHSEYTNSLNLLNFVKTGKEISEAVELHNSEQAFKTVFAHLALIIVGVLAIISPFIYAKHNKSI
ncbi:hypothetical protein A1QI_17920 [Vibrio genomosp. F10 str. 9ZB36]|nr:hypothetical protein A1QI_17920 [Vibrio genomosp. F10 str. 9ZB36]